MSGKALEAPKPLPPLPLPGACLPLSRFGDPPPNPLLDEDFPRPLLDNDFTILVPDKARNSPLPDDIRLSFFPGPTLPGPSLPDPNPPGPGPLPVLDFRGILVGDPVLSSLWRDAPSGAGAPSGV